MQELACNICSSYQATFICKSDNEVIPLGECCAIKHFSSLAHSHSVHQLEKTQPTLQDIQSISTFADISNALNKYRSSINSHREAILVSKQYIINAIESIAQRSMQALDIADQQIQNKFNLLDLYLKSPSEKAVEFMQKFKDKKLNGIIESFIDVRIEIEGVINEISKCISITKNNKPFVLESEPQSNQTSQEVQIEIPSEIEQELEKKLKKHEVIYVAPERDPEDFIVIAQYANNNVKESLKRLGPFKYDPDYVPGIDLERQVPALFKNGAVYIGQWNCYNERHGKGIQIWNDGSMYEGLWTHNRANGKGRFIHADGSVYEGDWVDDKANGEGIFMDKNGSRYEGRWKNNKRHGKGVETWPDASRYEGKYKYGKKNGFGRYLWPNGSLFEGEFQDDKRNGKGVYKWKDGRKYDGDWVDNRMDGHGTYEWPDGRSYVGEFRNDKKNGYGIFKWTNGNRYEGLWASDKQDGKGTMIYPNGERRQGEWKNGMRIV